MGWAVGNFGEGRRDEGSVRSAFGHTFWLGNSKMKDENGRTKGNSCVGYSSSSISMKNGKFTGTAISGPKNSLINFDPDNWNGGKDDNGSNHRPPFVGLAHEMGHSEANNNGTQTHEPYDCIPGTTPERERNSIKRENEIRGEHNLTPRTNYFYKPIISMEE